MNIKKFLPVAIFIIISSFVLLPFLANAYTGGPSATNRNLPNEAPNLINYLNSMSGRSGQASSDLPTFIGVLVKWILGIIGIILLILIVYGGFMYATSAGNEDKIETGKKIMTFAIIGIVVIVAAYIITIYVVQALIDRGTGYGETDSEQTNATPTDGTPSTNLQIFNGEMHTLNVNSSN